MPNFNATKYPTTEGQYWNHQSDWTISWLKNFLIKSGFEIKKITTSGILYKNTLLVPNNLCPSSLGDIIIIKAMKK